MQGGIGDWIVRRAHRRPNATALIDGESGRTVPYVDLERDVAATAASLHELGVRRGDRVAILMENSIEFVRVLFAAANLGAIVVPVNFRLNAREVRYILADSGALVLAVSDRFRDLATDALAEGGHGVRRILVETAGAPIGDYPVSRLDELLTAPRRGPDPLVRAEDTCVIMYTSGTTGSPKGAMLTHGNMQWNAFNMATVGSGLSGSTATIAVAPMFHIGALGLSVLPILYAGGTVITVRAFDPHRTLELMQRYQTTTQFMVPAMWAALSKVPDFDSYDVSSMQYVLCGGAPCPLPVIEFYQQRGWMFLEGFGMTEASPNTLLLDEESVVSHAGSVGRPFMHVDVRIVDNEDHDVAVGEVGELVLRGPNIFAGYWGRPAETAEATRGGWFHTGDLGRADADGFITLVDRKKDMIISGGENVYPIEVEQVLYRHPAVSEVAVIGVPDEKWGETVVAVVVPEGDGIDEAELIDYTRNRIAHFKCPRRVVFVEELPYTATGKLLKRTLREQFTGVAATVHR
ncbi:long-chain-fatty-acid--CoA ligase [Rhodococcus sp. YH1]|uniref:long-chain-fatty-acid--CoA ligase n=1 Tax=Rhodococcus sp. YH1 TaxID=89066 RepID=UPI0013874033|nr:Long-chain-fatty-acid--CoA ligase FadD13 [Rhodococcus sp. YH1]NCL78824.1 Long-chain-fatty-acid--CoA ligase FadD13 [Rhodococcus sp. YH1]